MDIGKDEKQFEVLDPEWQGDPAPVEPSPTVDPAQEPALEPAGRRA